MATNQISEQEIQFRKRARRRLVGAIALVLLMVTVLPMVLDDREVKTPRQDIAISIPSQDGGNFTSRIVPVTPKATTETPPAANVQLTSPIDDPKHVEGAVQKAAPLKSTSETSPPTPATKSELVAETPVTPVENPAESAATTKPAKEKSPTAATEKSASKKGGFFVQIGVFSESPKLKELEAKVVAKGFHLVREKLDTPKGAKVRLRIGPFSTRPDAESALSKLKSADVTGMIVTNK